MSTHKDRSPTKQEQRLMRRYPETDTFLWHNVNPKGHITDDCLMRAIAGASGMSWYDVFDGLRAVMRATARVDKTALRKYLTQEGWTIRKQPRKDDGTKYTGAQFCKWLSINYPNGELGNIIADIGGHHIVCIMPTEHGDGIKCRYKVIDTWNSTGRCIGSWWTHGRVDLSPFNRRKGI